MEEENLNNFDHRLIQEFNEQNFSFEESKEIVNNYSGSKKQIESYKKKSLNDRLYTNFIIQNYGSFENYLLIKNINEASTIFDPRVDFRVDVKIVTKDKMLVSDHISSDEVLLELLSGVCTLFFIKKNGSSRRLTGTLDSYYIPTSENITRSGFFSPLPGNRIGVWDLNEQKWKSFYISNLIKFIRDDTSGAE